MADDQATNLYTYKAALTKLSAQIEASPVSNAAIASMQRSIAVMQACLSTKQMGAENEEAVFGASIAQFEQAPQGATGGFRGAMILAYEEALLTGVDPAAALAVILNVVAAEMQRLCPAHHSVAALSPDLHCMNARDA